MKKLHYTFVTCALMLSLGMTKAQTIKHVEQCGFDKVHQEMMQDADYARKVDEFNQQLLPGNAERSAAPLLRIPVVVHVMHHGEAVGTGNNLSEEDIKKGIRLLNERFRKKAGGEGDGAGVDVEIEFALAVRDMSGNCTNGIVRVNMSGNSTYVNGGVGSGGITEATLKATSRWTDENYYNIYVVSEIDNANCYTGGSYTAGYAYFASSHGNSNDGTVILACSFVSSSTLTHELGHALNLYHTFEGGSCSQSSCSTQGDLCCDTPPHPGSNTDCTTPECTGTQQVENYMDYTGEECQDMFTANQTTRMRSALTTTRASFLESNGNMSLVPPGSPTADFTSDAAVVCNGSTVTFYDDSYCMPNSFGNDAWTGMSFSWTFDDGVNTPITSTNQNPSITFTTNGSYDVTLQVTNANGTNSITKQDFIVVSGSPVAGSCSPSIQNVGYFGYAISNVSFNSISNYTGSIENGNQDYTCDYSTVVYRDSSYTLSIDIEALGSQTGFYAVYIDYNNNGVINNSGETVLSGSLAAGNGPTTRSTTVTIPSTATQFVSLRMRVIHDQASLSGPCDNLFTGESEDYVVYVGTPPSSTTPVELVAFDAQKIYNEVELRWTTANERAFSHFELEHSTNFGEYEVIANMPTKGFVEELNHYTFLHKHPSLGVNYYRLKMVNNDGSYEYSDVRKIDFAVHSIRIAPNPFTDQLRINGVEGQATVTITNIMGEIVLSSTIEDSNTVLETNQLPAGSYMVIIHTENDRFVEKLIKSIH